MRRVIARLHVSIDGSAGWRAWAQLAYRLDDSAESGALDPDSRSRNRERFTIASIGSANRWVSQDR